MDGLDDPEKITLDRMRHCIVLVQQGDIAGYEGLSEYTGRVFSNDQCDYFKRRLQDVFAVARR